MFPNTCPPRAASPKEVFCAKIPEQVNFVRQLYVSQNRKRADTFGSRKSPVLTPPPEKKRFFLLFACPWNRYPPPLQYFRWKLPTARRGCLLHLNHRQNAFTTTTSASAPRTQLISIKSTLQIQLIRKHQHGDSMQPFE